MFGRLSLLLLALMALIMGASALSVQVEPREEQCVYEELEVGQQADLDVEVTRGGLLDIKIRVLDPHQNVIMERLAFFNRQNEALNEQEGQLTITASTPGVHKVCFDNTMSRWTPKVVSFRRRTAESNKARDFAHLEHLGPMVDSVIKISEELEQIEKLQHHMRVRERSHRDSQDSTNRKIQLLAVAESIVLVVISVSQYRKIQQWFNNARIGV